MALIVLPAAGDLVTSQVILEQVGVLMPTPLLGPVLTIYLEVA